MGKDADITGYTGYKQGGTNRQVCIIIDFRPKRAKRAYTKTKGGHLLCHIHKATVD